MALTGALTVGRFLLHFMGLLLAWLRWPVRKLLFFGSGVGMVALVIVGLGVSGADPHKLTFVVASGALSLGCYATTIAYDRLIVILRGA